jgi:signal transduction histidine kinase
MQGAAHAFDCEARMFITFDCGQIRSLSELLEANSLITIPIYYRHQAIGRFFAVSAKRDRFDKSDVTFLLQAVDHFIPIVENIRLVDQMATDAAEQERKKIARDIHDSIIQPYIGLQIGIESVSQIINGHNGDKVNISKLSSRVEGLKQIAEQGIEDLRDYVHGLTDGDTKRATFHDSMQRFACKFTSGTGIDVEINYDAELSIGDRLAAEVFQIFAESLSNVRKHTQSGKAIVNLSAMDDQLVMEICNKGDGKRAKNFRPRSIALRAESLGGSTDVFCNSGSTIVKVHIPM